MLRDSSTRRADSKQRINVPAGVGVSVSRPALPGRILCPPCDAEKISSIV
mgnify:CR=1 FL=1